MKIIDANLLIYAVNDDSPKHFAAKHWLESALNSSEITGFPWIVVLAFLRITTNERVFTNPMNPEDAIRTVDGWLTAGRSQIVTPGPSHWSLLRELLEQAGTYANHVSDAHIAALAIEHGARLYTTDSDFSRYQSLRWTNPVA